MPTFELSGPDGAAYHVDAPDAAAALDAFHSFVGAPPAPDIGDNRASTLAALRGVPIAGGYADKAAAALNAAAQPFTETGLSHADNFSDRMAENENTLKAGTDAYEKANPIGTTAGKIALGTAAMAPAVAAAPELLGAAGGFGARTLMGGLSNAAIGGADALTRGSNPLSGAVVGGALGAVAPAVALLPAKLPARLFRGSWALLIRKGTPGGRLPGLSRRAVGALTTLPQM